MDIAIILCCWLVSFLFAGIEAGLLSIDPVRLRHRVKRNMRAAIRLNALLRKPERLFVTVLLITNMADILGLLLLTRKLVWTFGPMGFFWALLIALPIYLFLLAVFPKSLFRRFPFRALAALAGLLELVSLILWPVLELGARFVDLLLPGRGEKRGRLFAAARTTGQRRFDSRRQGTDRALALTRFLPQWFHRHHAARQLVVADDERQRRTAPIGAAELSLEVAAAQVQLEAALRQLIAQPLHETQARRLRTRTIDDNVEIGRAHV